MFGINHEIILNSDCVCIYKCVLDPVVCYLSRILDYRPRYTKIWQRMLYVERTIVAF